MKKLNLPEQRRLLQSLPKHRLGLVKKHCEACQMKGDGVKDIVQKLGSILGPIVKEVGPTVLKEMILPYLKKKVKGKKDKKGGSLSLPGAGLKLAGVR